MDLDFKLVEQEVLLEDLIIHNQRVKRTLSSVDANHQYFEKRIVWHLIKADDIRFYSDAEIEAISKELFQPAYSEVKDFETLGNHILIKEVLDGNNCFEFTYQPQTNDIIMLCEVYRFNSLKIIRRPERMIKCMCFIYVSSGWTLFEQDFRRSKIFKSGLLVNKTAHNT